MEFSLEQLQELCAASLPLDMSSASSNRHFVRPDGVSKLDQLRYLRVSAPIHAVTVAIDMTFRAKSISID
jgi:hypothetical protein